MPMYMNSLSLVGMILTPLPGVGNHQAADPVVKSVSAGIVLGQE